MNNTQRQTFTIDAFDKPLGRVAVEAATLLTGKEKPTCVPYKDEGSFVVVENINKVKITGKKLKQKLYRSHTGWPGGFKEITMEKMAEKKGLNEVFKRAVLGMIPKNKLRKERIKRLSFK